jgi:hypothetical protein
VTKQADLIAYILDGQPHPFSNQLLQWMEASPRFTAFSETYRDKIRKKFRVNRELESMLDLSGELEVAYYLLNDRRLVVAYEPYASSKRRGPDFAVTYRTNLVFNVEVARIRMEGTELNETDIPRNEERLLRVLLDKLEQLQPGMPNLLVMHTQEELRRSIDLSRFMQGVKIRVEKKEPSFYAISRYTSPSAFYKDFLRLSGVLLWAAETQLWANKQARPGLSEKVLRLVSSLLSTAATQGLQQA